MSSGASDPALIGVDWGTSSFRAFLIDAGGTILQSKTADHGILKVKDRNFRSVLESHINDWLEGGSLPVIISGMVTSRNGWIETPYADLPAGVDVLASSLTSRTIAPGFDLHLVSGLTTRNDGAPDVMRGEETQIAGILEDGIRDGIIVMPGTHSKWLILENGLVENYATFMTGEIFAALCSNTILGQLAADGPPSPQAFARGVERARERGTELLHSLFSVRTLRLFDELAAHETTEYLSGLLIGAEIQGAMALLGEPDTVRLVGRHDLNERYQLALQTFGIDSAVTREDSAARGHYSIARAKGLLS